MCVRKWAQGEVYNLHEAQSESKTGEIIFRKSLIRTFLCCFNQFVYPLATQVESDLCYCFHSVLLSRGKFNQLQLHVNVYYLFSKQPASTTETNTIVTATAQLIEEEAFVGWCEWTIFFW